MKTLRKAFMTLFVTLAIIISLGVATYCFLGSFHVVSADEPAPSPTPAASAKKPTPPPAPRKKQNLPPVAAKAVEKEVGDDYPYEWNGRVQCKDISDDQWITQGYHKKDAADLALNGISYHNWTGVHKARTRTALEHELFWCDANDNPCYRCECGNPVDFIIVRQKHQEEVVCHAPQAPKVCYDEDCFKRIDPVTKRVVAIGWIKFPLPLRLENNHFPVGGVVLQTYPPTKQAMAQLHRDHPTAGHTQHGAEGYRVAGETQPQRNLVVRSQGQNPLEQIVGLVVNVGGNALLRGQNRRVLQPPPPHWEVVMTPFGPRQELVQ